MKTRVNWDSLLLRPASERYVPVADGLRALCVGVVMWFHVWQQSWLNPSILGEDFNWLVRSGYMLVEPLLTLSGFLLFLPWARAAVSGAPSPSARAFYKKRAVRILPSYLLCVFVMLFCVALPQHQYASSAEMWKDLLTHLTFTNVFFPAAYTYTHLNVVLWTVTIEVQFYLLFPLLARAFRKYPLLTYAAMTAAALAFRFGYAARLSDTTHVLNQLPAMLDVFANGMLAAYAYQAAARSFKPNRAASALLTLVSVACIYGVCQLIRAQTLAGSGDYTALRLGQMQRRYAVSFLTSIFLVSASHALRPFQFLFGNRVMRFLSSVSFQAYIWHNPLALQLKYWRFPAYSAPSNPQFYSETVWQRHYTLVCFLGALLLATLVTYLFEKPLARLFLRGEKKCTGDVSCQPVHPQTEDEA